MFSEPESAQPLNQFRYPGNCRGDTTHSQRALMRIVVFLKYTSFCDLQALETSDEHCIENQICDTSNNTDLKERLHPLTLNRLRE